MIFDSECMATGCALVLLWCCVVCVRVAILIVVIIGHWGLDVWSIQINMEVEIYIILRLCWLLYLCWDRS